MECRNGIGRSSVLLSRSVASYVVPVITESKAIASGRAKLIERILIWVADVAEQNDDVKETPYPY